MSSFGTTATIPPASPRKVVRFGVFEYDFTAGKLTRNGRDVPLQQQPAMLLAHLLQRSGKLVQREELRTTIWPSGTHVEFDLGLNTAVNRLRRALGDSANEPRYIETIPKQGYRFIAPLEMVLPVGGPRPQEPGVGLEAPVAGIAETPAAPYHNGLHGWKLAIAWAAAGAIVAVASMLVFGGGRRNQGIAVEGREYRYVVSLPPGHDAEMLAISPAGDQIVYQAAVRQSRLLYRRYLNEEEPRPIPNSENAEQPFFSPDGKEVGFYSPKSLRIAGVSGSRDIVPVPPEFGLRGAFWSPDGFIYFTTAGADAHGTRSPGIWRIPARGGAAQLVLNASAGEKGAIVTYGQQILAGGNPALLYSINMGPLRRSIELLDLASSVSKRLVERGMGGRILPTGHLFYYWRSSLLAAPFDVHTRKLTGSPMEVVQGVAANGWRGPRAAVSDNGTLVYVKWAPARRTLVWVGPDGRETLLDLPAADYQQAEVSPDGNRIAIARRDEPDRWTLWLYDLRTTAWTRLAETTVPEPRAIWSPDGTSLVVSATQGDVEFVNLYRIPLAAPQKWERLTEQPDFGHYPHGWSGPANAILFVEGTHPATQSDIFLLPLTGVRRPRPLVTTPGPDRGPTFSPDGHSFAYASATQGGSEVFLQPLDQTAPPRQISQGGGSDPLWARDGKRIFFLGTGASLMAVDVSGPTPGRPQQIHPAGFTIPQDWWTRPYSVAPDGRFLVIRNQVDAAAQGAQIHVIVNWLQELRRLAPNP